MTNLIVELSKFAFIILIALFTLLGYSVLTKKNQGELKYGWKLQNLLMFFFHLLAYVVLYLQTEQIKILIVSAVFTAGSSCVQRHDLSKDESSVAQQYVPASFHWVYYADAAFL